MRFSSLSFVNASVLCSLITACSGDGSSASDETGFVELALGETPSDASCLVLDFAGSRSSTRRLELAPARPASFRLDSLPVGLTAIDAKAYALPCGSVGPSTQASYILEAPAIARIDATRVTRVVLSLIPNGKATVDVEFQSLSSTDPGEPLTLAVIGDTPYGAQQLADFPAFIQALNASGVHSVVHVGDIKNGSTRCDSSYFSSIHERFQSLRLPLHFTPGDNEWADCHRANNGAYDPLERLAELRSVFFGDPDVTLGAARPVLSQGRVPAHAAFVENQIWYGAGTVFASVHVVGSNNGLAPWFGTDTTGTLFDDPDRRTAEVEARVAAALDWIARAFDLAVGEDAAGLVLFMQADTFLGSTSGFREVITLLAERARSYAKPVLLVQGDSHRYLTDEPLATGSAEYGISEPVPNLRRIVVEGETTSEWLELRVDPRAPSVFSWQRRSRTE